MDWTPCTWRLKMATSTSCPNSSRGEPKWTRLRRKETQPSTLHRLVRYKILLIYLWILYREVLLSLILSNYTPTNMLMDAGWTFELISLSHCLIRHRGLFSFHEDIRDSLVNKMNFIFDALVFVRILRVLQLGVNRIGWKSVLSSSLGSRCRERAAIDHREAVEGAAVASKKERDDASERREDWTCAFGRLSADPNRLKKFRRLSSSRVMSG